MNEKRYSEIQVTFSCGCRVVIDRETRTWDGVQYDGTRRVCAKHPDSKVVQAVARCLECGRSFEASPLGYWRALYCGRRCRNKASHRREAGGISKTRRRPKGGNGNDLYSGPGRQGLGTVAVDGVELEVVENLGYQIGVNAAVRIVRTPDGDRRAVMRRHGRWHYHITPILPRGQVVGQ